MFRFFVCMRVCHLREYGHPDTRPGACQPRIRGTVFPYTAVPIYNNVIVIR